MPWIIRGGFIINIPLVLPTLITDNLRVVTRTLFIELLTLFIIYSDDVHDHSSSDTD